MPAPMIVYVTYEVKCTSCGETRWPRLPERPINYVCSRCTAVGPEKRAKRVSRAARGQKSRWSPSQTMTSASAEGLLRTAPLPD
jgi:hypothetical protein